MNNYYLLKDYGSGGYSLEEYETIEEALEAIKEEQLDNYQTVFQGRIFKEE